MTDHNRLGGILLVGGLNSDRNLNINGTQEGRVHRHPRPEEGPQQAHGTSALTQVEEALNDENSSIQLSQAKMSELKIFKGDAIFIKGKKRKETIAVALVDNKL